MKFLYHSIESRSYVDGPGERTVFFAQGCPIHCPGCQSPHLWGEDGGKAEETVDIAIALASLTSRTHNLTLSGGECLAQPEALAELLSWVRNITRGLHIVLYSGYTWEELHNPKHPAYPWINQIMSRVDILVDGRFIISQDDPMISWRGSRNQRVINVPATLKAGKIVTEQWDGAQVIIDSNGNILMPVGLSWVMTEIGNPEPTRRCGEVK
jgi:anaerobic ribonucleoside-triphosphate reductase activating protein